MKDIFSIFVTVWFFIYVYNHDYEFDKDDFVIVI